MKGIADIYRAEIVRAVFGPGAHAAQIADPTRLAQIAEHLAGCEEAQAIIRAKGHGHAGMSFVELARSLPDHAIGKIKRLFRPADPKPVMVTEHGYPDIGEMHDIWSAR